MKIMVKCFNCGHQWAENHDKVTHCPECHEWFVYPMGKEKMQL